MDMKDLFPLALTLLLVGIIAGVGVLILGDFSDAVKQDTVIVENVSLTNAAGTVTYTAIRSLDECFAFKPGNTTKQLDVGDDTSDATCKYNDYGQIVVNDTQFITANVTYTAGLATTTSGILDTGTSAVGDIATDWLGLIVTIACLALILGLTLMGFSYASNRR